MGRGAGAEAVSPGVGRSSALARGRRLMLAGDPAGLGSGGDGHPQPAARADQSAARGSGGDPRSHSRWRWRRRPAERATNGGTRRLGGALEKKRVVALFNSLLFARPFHGPQEFRKGHFHEPICRT